MDQMMGLTQYSGMFLITFHILNTMFLLKTNYNYIYIHKQGNIMNFYYDGKMLYNLVILLPFAALGARYIHKSIL
jgi:hypothetical protein